MWRERKKENLDSIQTHYTLLLISNVYTYLLITVPNTQPFLSIHAVEQIHFNTKSFPFLLKRVHYGFLSLSIQKF